MKIFKFTHIMKGIGSTHQGILGTYTTNFGVNITSSKEEHCSKTDDTIYQMHYISGKQLTRILDVKGVVG